MRWQFVVNKQNEAQIKQAKALADELGMEIFFKPTWDINDRSRNTNLKDGINNFAAIAAEKTSNLESQEPKRQVERGTCLQMFLQPYFNWDGRLLGCCCLYQETYGGNVFEVGLELICKNEAFVDAKRLLAGRETSGKTKAPCLKCGKYREIERAKAYITAMEICE